jgi:hypothetical protein
LKSALVALLIGILLASSGCIQPKEAPVVLEKAASEEWKPDGVVGEDEYARSMVLQCQARQGYTGGRMEISWKNDQEFLYMALNGSTSGWLAVGFEPTEWMKDADIILGYVEGEKATVLDEYSTGNYGPHIEDTMLGGTNDILQNGGRRDGANTVIEFKRKLDTGDRFDRSMHSGETVSLIWAMADSSDQGVKHNIAYGEGIIPLIQENATTVSAAVPSPREVQGILFIWQEEKAARDLYISLYEETNLSIFMDLVRSEQNHMDQAKSMIDKFGLQTPVSDVPGELENQTLREIYNRLLAQGRLSHHEALKSAATFEEISIMDLEKEIAATNMEEIRVVYQGLLAGSRKHLRSYVMDLQELGIQYSPHYISSSEFEEIMRRS